MCQSSFKRNRESYFRKTKVAFLKARKNFICLILLYNSCFFDMMLQEINYEIRSFEFKEKI